MMSRILLAAFAAVTLAGCRDRDEVATGDLQRDIELAPVDTTAVLGDEPVQEDEPATPAAPAQPQPEPRTRPETAPSAPAPAPAAEALASGTSSTVVTDKAISSEANKVGDQVTASVSSDVTNDAGEVVIPDGAQVTLEVTAIEPSDSRSDTTGTLTLRPVSITVAGESTPLAATISGVESELQGEGVGAGDIAKVGAGAAAGAVVGRVLGGSTKGAIIGAVIGGAVGTQRAIETKDRAVVVPEGTTMTLTLDERFVAPS
jgi:hypothetical protein